ncbi:MULTISPECIES: hypothetical protein [Planktothrix]|jgi:hypothetical protein|uniref:Uncharacterized protein n=1 Tax=Planktothrix agardhii TaxID=1160 RepID=A0AAD1Q7C0_PLAAG|nr:MULTISPECIES: hypothetical protein [Planktothrix]MCB8753339.1 hypothetical protein [Planktothrix agardhii 1810]MCF3609774.1 hypothetical protein [Planktothrix agardhii 1033]CAD5983206.1 hypothetical protein PANO66_04338 [Planktothrix agardhii]CAD5985788.1 hypothetical protein PCC7821_05000 [Planktothrix rubescens NIVA-CYA 18]
MKELQELAEFWLTVKEGESKFQEREFISRQSFKYLHCLNHYPNEYWKYVTSAYFFKNKDSDSFYTSFSEYLATLVSFLFSEFVQKPTVNAIKDSCYQFCIDIFEGKPLTITSSISSEFSMLVMVISDKRKINIRTHPLLMLMIFQNTQVMIG